jgi:hypothetical protein
MAEQLSAMKEPNISSLDIVSFDGGIDQRGAANVRTNNYTKGRNVMVNEQGLATHRYGLQRWLPDTIGTVYQVFPLVKNGSLYYFVADNGKIRYCQEGDRDWTDCAGDTVTTDGVVTTFIRRYDLILILNGEDTLGYVMVDDFTVHHSTKVDNPTTKPTLARKSLSSGSHNVYYAIAYNGEMGQTAISPISSIGNNKIRAQWAAGGGDGITITDPNTRPAGAESWNLYCATSISGTVPQASDMLPLKLGIDLNTTEFFDDGTLTINLSTGTAPEDNSTEGPKAAYGIIVDDYVILYGVKDDAYAFYISSGRPDKLSFSVSDGGFRHVGNQGTNYYPMSVIGYRSGRGVPSITVMYSNTEGLSKQTILEPQTVSYGNSSFLVWTETDQNYGAAGVSSPYGVVNYRGALRFPTYDGFAKLSTQASLQNVLLPERISDPIVNEIKSIKTENLPQIVGTAWANRIFWSVPSRGFDYNNEIIVADVSRRDTEAWMVWDIPSQWLGVISPNDSAAFVYVCQDNHIFRLQESYVALDETSDGLTKAFPVELETALIGTDTAHDGFYAVVQVVFYLLDFIGSVDLEINYRDYRSGKMRTHTKTVTNGEYAKSHIGGWSSPGYLFNQELPTKVLTWADVAKISDAGTARKNSRQVVFNLINVVTNELKAGVSVNLDKSAVVARSISFQGENLGISPGIS